MKLFVFLIVAIVTLSGMTQNKKDQKTIDDWEYNSTIIQNATKLHMMRNMVTSALPSPAPMLKSLSNANIGFATGGAKDSNNFDDNIKNGYLPKLKSITYEGVFYQHYFDTYKKSPCENLFCLSYSTATTQNLFSGEKEYYLSVGLNSNIKASDFKRKVLNLIVVLDISGSMSSPFTSYYYDRKNKTTNKENETKSKMQIANISLVNMLKHLHPQDSLGIVLFDNNAYLAKPLHKVAQTNMDAIKKHILDLKARGGTNWSKGYKKGLSLFDKLKPEQKDPLKYENRIIFITDAMPNQGELSKEGLFGMVDKASKMGIYTTFIGVGIDFNSNLLEQVSKTKGANYYGVHSIDDFKKRLDDEFDFMVTPLVFDLSFSLQSQGYNIEAIYGSPQANLSTNRVMYINTLFPSQNKESKTKGSIVIVKVSKQANSKENLQLKVSYKDRNNKTYHSSKSVHFKDGFYFQNTSIQKGILLSQYVTLMQNWLIDTRKSCNDNPSPRHQTLIPLMQRCMIYPPKRPEYKYIKTWERSSCPLQVMKGYQNIFTLFKRKFKDQMQITGDKTLQKELDILEKLSHYNQKETNHDDWQTER